MADKTPPLKSLVTGVTGFAGSHMAEMLLKKGHEVYGTYRWRSRVEHISHLNGHLHLVEADLLDLKSLQDLLISIRPDYIFHLAAQSFVKASWNGPEDTIFNNIMAELNIFLCSNEKAICFWLGREEAWLLMIFFL